MKISTVLITLAIGLFGTISTKAQTLNPTYSIRTTGDADNFNGGYTFSYATAGTPWNGALISFGGLGNRYDCQINADYGQNGGNRISFRTKNGDYGIWNPWNELVTSLGDNNFVGNQNIAGSLGIATTKLSSQLTVGEYHGVKLSVGGTNWVSKNILSTSWVSGIGDITDLNVVGQHANSASIRLIENGNVGIGVINPTSLLTVGEYHGVKLSVGGANWVSKNILSTSWVSGIGDFTDLSVVGQYANNASIRLIENGNVGIGVVNPKNKLDVNGTIHSKEVKVDMLGWSDFVFKKEYDLPTLKEVEKHIGEKGHLENIPSEEEVLKNGINLGEMNAKLLRKIEELTLYMIEMKKEIETQNEKIMIFENKLSSKK